MILFYSFRIFGLWRFTLPTCIFFKKRMKPYCVKILKMENSIFISNMKLMP